MHALDWLTKRGRILRGAIQPIEGVHFIVLVFVLVGLCDRAFTQGIELQCQNLNSVSMHKVKGTTLN